MEKGFSFEIPKESRERLKKHFLKHVDEDGSRIEKQSSHHEEKYNDW